jgi:ribosomal protein S18 acetylase RimI-like enzyme
MECQVTQAPQTSVTLEWRDTQDGVDWDELAAFYRAVPLGNKKAPELKVVFTASLFKFFVYDAGQLVGVGRVLADGVDCAYLCDVAVHPSHQGSGLGKAIVARLVELSKHHKKIILYAVPGKEPFYRKLGFKRMATAMAIFSNPTQALERGYISED